MPRSKFPTHVELIKQVQHALNVEADGLWGKNTEAAAEQILKQTNENNLINALTTVPGATVNKDIEIATPKGRPWIDEAIKLLGTAEIKGANDNPKIVALWRDVGIDWNKDTHIDEIPWCAAFVGACLYRAGYIHTKSGMARSYLKYGKPSTLKKGAIVIFPRGNPPSGHVGIVTHVSMNKKYEVISGNIGNTVKYTKHNLGDEIAFRYPVQRRR